MLKTEVWVKQRKIRVFAYGQIYPTKTIDIMIGWGESPVEFEPLLSQSLLITHTSATMSMFGIEKWEYSVPVVKAKERLFQWRKRLEKQGFTRAGVYTV